MLKIAHHGLFDSEVVQKLERYPSVLGGNEVGLLQGLDRSGRKIAEIAYRRSDKIQLSAHGVPSL